MPLTHGPLRPGAGGRFSPPLAPQRPGIQGTRYL